MQEQSITSLRNWLLDHRDELKAQIPLPTALLAELKTETRSKLLPRQIIEFWKGAAQSIPSMGARPEVVDELHKLVALAENEVTGEPKHTHSGNAHSKLMALTAPENGGLTSVNPLFWRGCIAGAILGSEFGVAGSILGCLAVGALGRD